MKGYKMRHCAGEHCGCKVSHSVEYNYETEAMEWRCYNCGRASPIRKRRVVIDKDGITKTQRQIIEQLKERLLAKNNRQSPGRCEIKRCDITASVTKASGGGFVSVAITIGSVGDEGTMASVFCRDYRHFFIGTRGGITLVNAKGGRKKGWFEAVHGLTEN